MTTEKLATGFALIHVIPATYPQDPDDIQVIGVSANARSLMIDNMTLPENVAEAHIVDLSTCRRAFTLNARTLSWEGASPNPAARYMTQIGDELLFPSFEEIQENVSGYAVIGIHEDDDGYYSRSLLRLTGDSASAKRFCEIVTDQGDDRGIEIDCRRFVAITLVELATGKVIFSGGEFPSIAKRHTPVQYGAAIAC